MSTNRSHGRRPCPAATVALVVALAGGALSGCGGSGDAGPGPGSVTTTASNTNATTALGSTGVPPTTATAPTSAPSDSVSPATGPALMSASVTLRLPTGWVPNGKDFLQPSGFDKAGDTGGDVIVDDQPRAGNETVEEGARLALMFDKQDGLKPVRQPNITVDGVEGYVITGGSFADPIYFEFGTVANDHNIVISVAFANKIPADQAQATIDSILASVLLKS